MKADRAKEETKKEERKKEETKKEERKKEERRKEEKTAKEADKNDEAVDSTSDIFKKIEAYKKKFEASKGIYTCISFLFTY